MELDFESRPLISATGAGESQVQVQSKLWSEFKANLGNLVKNLPQNKYRMGRGT